MHPGSIALLTILSLCSSSLAQVSDAAAKVASLRAAASSVQRVGLLEDNEFVFDFLHANTGQTVGAAGHTVQASSANFPAVIGNGMAMTIGFLGPCGMNTPHTHPRATEFNFLVNGTLQTGFLAENGARFVFNEVQAGMATVFPKGAIHFEMNNGCEDVLFVAAFNDEDPGVDQVAQRLFGLPPAFISATFGSLGVEQVAGLEAKIPDNVALGTEECLQRCGITRGDQPTNQRQPRVSANALPNGFSGPSTAATPTNAAGTVATAASSATSNELQSPTHSVSGKISSLEDESGKPNPLIIVLIVLVTVLSAGYIALAAAFFMRRSREKKAQAAGDAKYFRTSGADSDASPWRATFYNAEKGHSAGYQTPYDPPKGGA